MKKKCSLCNGSQGKRICLVRENTRICPLCCATHRNHECTGCQYYVHAQQYQQEKLQSAEPRHYIIEVNQEVADTVDRALEFVEHKQYHQAEQLLKPLKRSHPQNHLVHYGLGTLAANQGDLDRGLEHFEQATNIFPYFLEAHFNKAVTYKKKLNIRKMIEAFREVIEIGDPKDDCVLLAQEILNDCERIIMKSDCVSLDRYLEGCAIFERGVACLAQHSWEEAIQWFRKSLAILPRHPQSYGNIGLCYGYLGHKKLALEAFDKALEFNPHYEVAIVNRIVVKKLPEGGCLLPENEQTVEYYKDYPMQNKSFIDEYIQKFCKRQ